MEMGTQPHEFEDIEARVCPTMLELPEQQKALFICKVYLIVAIQLLLTFIVVFIILISISPIYFILNTSAGVIFYLIICITMITSFCLLYRHRFANFLLLGVFTTAIALLVGFTCAPASGGVILESMVVTAAVVLNLTLYAFWGASRGHDFDFLGPFLFASVLLILLVVSVQIIFPLDKIFVRMYGILGSITFCGHIVYVTDTLIIRSHSYNKYIRAAVCLFVEFINLFLLFFTVFRAFH